MKLPDQSWSLKRASPFSGSATGCAGAPSIFIQVDCHNCIESIHQLTDALASTLGSIAACEYRSMNAFAMPSSSRIADDRLAACFCAKSPRMREERSATAWRSLACSSWLGGCITHDAIAALLARRAPGVVKVMQVGYRLAHGEESLVQVQFTFRKHDAEQVAGALRPAAQYLRQDVEFLAVVPLELGDAGMGAAERPAVRRQDQHVGWKFPIALDRIEEQAQRIALRIDRPHADVGRDGRKQHVAGDHRIELFGKKRQVLGRVAMADHR